MEAPRAHVRDSRFSTRSLVGAFDHGTTALVGDALPYTELFGVGGKLVASSGRGATKASTTTLVIPFRFTASVTSAPFDDKIQPAHVSLTVSGKVVRTLHATGLGGGVTGAGAASEQALKRDRIASEILG